jgi:hypothetical protein
MVSGRAASQWSLRLSIGSRSDPNLLKVALKGRPLIG